MLLRAGYRRIGSRNGSSNEEYEGERTCHECRRSVAVRDAIFHNEEELGANRVWRDTAQFSQALRGPDIAEADAVSVDVLSVEKSALRISWSEFGPITQTEQTQM